MSEATATAVVPPPPPLQQQQQHDNLEIETNTTHETEVGYSEDTFDIFSKEVSPTTLHFHHNNEDDIDEGGNIDEEQSSSCEIVTEEVLTKLTTTTTTTVNHNNNNYGKLSAAGAHFAKRRAEESSSGGSTSPMKPLRDTLGKLTSGLIHHGKGGQHEDGNDSGGKEEEKDKEGSDEGRDEKTEVAEPRTLSSMSAALEHFAKLKAERTTAAAAVKKKKKYLEKGEEEKDNGEDTKEHFARKKSEGEMLSPSFKGVLSRMTSSSLIRHNSITTEEEEKKDEGRDEKEAEEEESNSANEEKEDHYRHLSAAGEHFARKKSEGDTPTLRKRFSRMTSSLIHHGRGSQIEESGIDQDKGDDKEEEESIQEYSSMSAAGELPSADKIDTSQDDPAAGDEFSDPFVQEISTSDDSYGKDFDHAADALDGVFNVTAEAQVMDMEEKCDVEMSPTQSLPTLTAEEKEMESKDLPSSSAASTTATLPQVDKIQRMPAYTLHRDLIIGKGSYGHVCVASRGETEGYFSSKPGRRKKYACKSVSLTGLDPKHICKLQEEVNVLRVLRGHKNVIRLYDVFVVDTELVIITELGTGGDLFHLLSTHPKHGFSEEYAAKTASDMLSAVAFLHSQHIVHRDLKIENWVLKSGNNLWSPLKLIDFGLSTHFTPGHKLSRVAGSSYYIAPQILKKCYTEACDIWSLGVTVYILLSGAPPFFGPDEEMLRERILKGKYVFPQELFCDVSEDALNFVSGLLAYEEEDRLTAIQALNHPWLEANCKPEQLARCKVEARGKHVDVGENATA